MAKNVLGRNYTFPIYKADGTPFFGLVMRKSTFESVVMSLGDKITGDVYYKDNTLPITMQEYIEYKENPSDENEQAVKYFLLNPPTITKEGLVRDNSELSGMTKYSFVFYHPMCLLANLPFSDVATSSNQERYLSENKEFSWIGTPSDYIAKINKNLQDTEWVVVKSERFPQGKDNELSEVLQFNNETIADALKKGYDTWGVPFVVDTIKEGEYTYIDEHNQEIDYYSVEGGSKRFVVVVGLPSNEIYASSIDKQMGNPFVFRYGKGVGLKNNSRTPRNNKIITRISGYGSEKNVPFGYPQIVWTGNQDWDYTINNDASNPLSYPIYKGIVGGQYVKLIKHPFTRKHLMPSVYTDCVNKKVNPFATGYDPTIELVDYYDAIGGDYPNNINPLSPSYESHEFDVKPELDSEREIGLVSAIPLNADLTPASAWDDTMDDDGNYLQSYFQITLPQLSFDIYACAAITEEMQINMRSGDCMGCTFNIQVDWEDYKRNFYDENGNFVPNGSQRDLTRYPKSNEGQISVIAQKDNNTFGILLPNTYQHPKSGDNFVILGISLPIEYIHDAELRLDEVMQSYMLENNVYYYDYPLKFDEHFLATHTNILSQIKTNTIIRFDFAGNVLQLYVKQLSIKYGYGLLPQYDITLTDNIEVVLNQIGQVADDVERLGSLISILRQDYSRNVWLELSKKLSKTEDDVARGIITFLQGVVFGPANSIWGYVRNTIRNGTTIAHAWFRNLFAENFETAIAKVNNYITGNNGRLLIQDDVTIQKANNADATLNVAEIESKNIDNSDTIKTHNLVVTGLAHFFELVIDKIRAAGGAMILTPAEGFVVVDILPSDVVFPQDPNNMIDAMLEGKVLYFKASDGNGKSINQSWKVGDQAICMNFNSVEQMTVGEVAHNVSNKYYWAVVYAVSDTPQNRTIDGETVPCHWIAIYSAVSSDGIPDGIPTTGGVNPIPCDGIGNNTGNPLWDGDPMSAAIGDEIAMLGSRVSEDQNDNNYAADARERKTAIYMSAYSALDVQLTAPFLAFYQGIDDFNLSTHRKTYMDANGSKFFGEFYALSATGNGKDLTSVVNSLKSRYIISGGESKQGLLREWTEWKTKFDQVSEDFVSNSLTNKNDTYRNGSDIPIPYDDARTPTYRNVWQALNIYAYAHLRNMLNSYMEDETLEFDEESGLPLWLRGNNINNDTDLSEIAEGWNEYINGGTPVVDIADEYARVWQYAFEMLNEAQRALDAYRMGIINDIGSDNVLSSKEKAMLRQTFASEISEYFKLKSELAAFGTTIYKEVEDPNDETSTITVEVSTMYVEAAIDALGTYLNGDNDWKVEQQAEPDAQTTYWPTYPLWISESSTTSSTAITASEFSAKWADVFDAMETLSADIANASQEKIDHITASVEVPNKYVTVIDPLQNPSISANVKEGDYWYQPVTLNDPIHGGTLSGDYYNEYLCQGSGNGKHWVLLNAAQAALLNVARDICLAVFDTDNSSSIVQMIDSIAQSVRGMRIGGRNLILNSDFSERNGSVPRRFEPFGTSVYLALDNTDAPTSFTGSLLVTANAAGGGLCLPLGTTGQPNLRLESGSGYVLSFYIKLTQHTGTAPIIEVKRGIPTNAVVIPNGSAEIDETWQRLSFIIDGDGNNVPIYITKQTSGAFRIAGLQLEKGNVLSDWRRAEEDWQGQIELTKTQINLRVTRDGLAQAGLQINGEDESVTIIGKKTKIDGDLDIQGLTTENVTVVDWNTQRPIVVNMGLFQDDTDDDNVTVKSVQVKARNVPLTESNIGIPPLVALPFYDSAIEGSQQNNWRVNGDTYITFEEKSIGENRFTYTFKLFEDNSVPDSEKRIMTYKRNGTRLTIINEADPYLANWKTLETYQNNQTLRNNVRMLMGNAVVVCADARIISSENIEAEGGNHQQLIPNNTEEDWKWNAGTFSCAGYRARFIVVLPGQTLQLRSQIMTIDKENKTQDVLVWVVENSSEFAPMKNQLSCDGIMLYQGYQPTFAPTQSHRGVEDCWMGHPVLNLANDMYNPITLDLALVRYGVEGD